MHKINNHSKSDKNVIRKLQTNICYEYEWKILKIPGDQIQQHNENYALWLNGIYPEDAILAQHPKSKWYNTYYQ
jgi:hypothetical protein